MHNNHFSKIKFSNLIHHKKNNIKSRKGKIEKKPPIKNSIKSRKQINILSKKILEIPNEYSKYINYSIIRKNAINITKRRVHPMEDKIIKSASMIQKLQLNKNNIIHIGNNIYPPSGGGQHWLLTMCRILSDKYFNIIICFKDEYMKVFSEINIIKKKNFIVIQMPYVIVAIMKLIKCLNPVIINHQGSSRTTYMNIANNLRIPFVTGFCFWNDLLDDQQSLNFNMKSKKFQKSPKLDNILKNATCYLASPFMKEITDKLDNININILETDNPFINISNKNKQMPIYVTLLNCHPLKGGQVLLYLLTRLDKNIPLLAVITEDYNNPFYAIVKKLFEFRNRRKNINKLFIKKIENVKKIYDVTKILLVPSIVDETFCRVAAEGKHNGITILYNSTGNLKYLLSDYENSYGFKINYSIINKADLMYTSSSDFEKWNNKIMEIYHTINPNKFKLIHDNITNIKHMEKNILDLFSKAVDKNNKQIKLRPKYIGLYGPFYSQGLGIQLREYYYFLKEKGFNVAAFSHIPFESCIASSNMEDWQFENIYRSGYLRADPKMQEIKVFLIKYNVKCLIIPEICYVYFNKIISLCKILDVKTIGVINIETLKIDEIETLIHDLDIFACNNISTFKILQAFVPKEKLRILLFDNVYFPKYYPPKIKDITKVKFAIFGGLNSSIRKQIPIVWSVFNKLTTKNLLDHELNIYIQAISAQEASTLIKCPKDAKNINVFVNNHSYNSIINIIKETDIIIHMGSHEGLGLGFFEALNNNKPIITIDTYPNKELVTHKQNGFIVKGRYTALTDNNMGIINKCIVDEDSFKNLLLEILNPEYKSELIDIINRDKHVENDYAKNFCSILKELDIK